MESGRAALHEEIRARLRDRPRTVMDARRMLAPDRSRLIRIVIDDGDRSGRVLYGVYRKLVRDGHGAFRLVLQGLMPVRAKDIRRRRKGYRELTEIPVAICTELPDRLQFLHLPPEAWPVPASFVSCPTCTTETWGRFCADCGAVVRRGRERSDPGEGFRVAQAILATRGEPCGAGCGGHLADFHRHCAKCGFSREAEVEAGLPAGETAPVL